MARRQRVENLHESVHSGASIKNLDARGWEIPDPNPVAIPAGFKRPETLAEQVQRLVRTSISREAELRGDETFEEADDFEMEDEEEDYTSPYETFFDPVLGKDLSPQEFRQNEQRYRQEYLRAQQQYFQHQDRMRVMNRGSAEGVSPSAPDQVVGKRSASDRRQSKKSDQTKPSGPAEQNPED